MITFIFRLLIIGFLCFSLFSEEMLAPASLFIKQKAEHYLFPFKPEELNEKLDLLRNGYSPLLLDVPEIYLDQWKSSAIDIKNKLIAYLDAIANHYETLHLESKRRLINSIREKITQSRIQYSLSAGGIVLSTHDKPILLKGAGTICSPFTNRTEKDFEKLKPLIFSLDEEKYRSMFWHLILDKPKDHFQAVYMDIWESGRLDINLDQLYQRTRNLFYGLNKALTEAPEPMNMPSLEDALIGLIRQQKEQQKGISWKTIKEQLKESYSLYTDKNGRLVDREEFISDFCDYYELMQQLGVEPLDIMKRPEIVKSSFNKAIEAYFYYFHFKTHSPMAQVIVWSTENNPEIRCFQFPPRKISKIPVTIEISGKFRVEFTGEMLSALIKNVYGMLEENSPLGEIYRKYKLADVFDFKLIQGQGFKEEIGVITPKKGVRLFVGNDEWKEGKSLVLSTFRETREALMLQEIYNSRLLNHPGVVTNYGLLKGSDRPVMISNFVSGIGLKEQIAKLSIEVEGRAVLEREMKRLKITEGKLEEALVSQGGNAAEKENIRTRLENARKKWLEADSMKSKHEQTKIDHPLNAEQLLSIMIQFAGILSENHRNRIIHHDIKPGNINFSADSCLVHLLDFGGSENKNFPYQPNGVSTSIDYITPEKMVFDRLSRSQDIFQTGLVFLELLSGRNVILDMAVKAGIILPGKGIVDENQLLRVYEYFSAEGMLENYIHDVFESIRKEINIKGFDASHLKSLEFVLKKLMIVQKDERMTASEFIERLMLLIPKGSILEEMSAKAMEIVQLCSQDLMNYDPEINPQEISGSAIIGEMIPLLLHLNAEKPLSAMTAQEIVTLWEETYSDRKGLRDINAWLASVCEWHSPRHPQFGDARTQKLRFRINSLFLRSGLGRFSEAA